MELHFELNGEAVRVDDVSPTRTILQYLRREQRLTGTKEGCAEGDCGACTIVVQRGERLESINSCLVPLAQLHGLRAWTVEGLGGAHPAQLAMVQRLGSQCGYCTPGIVMSLVEACHRTDLDAPWKLEDQLCGNLCRCTGYRPIREAARAVAGSCPADGLGGAPTRSEAFDGSFGGTRYRRPIALDEALLALEENPEIRIMAGSTDLGLRMTKHHEHWPEVLDVTAIEELCSERVEDGHWVLGASVRLSHLEDRAAALCPPIARMLRFFGARQIKHQGTLGGNLCNASPIGDMAPVMLALGAEVVLASTRGRRVLPIEEFFTGYRQTALAPSELLLAVRVPLVPASARCVTYKVSKRRELDISAVSAGLYCEVVDGRVCRPRLAFGGMAATPARARGAEAALEGQPWGAVAVDAVVAALAADFSPMSDHRGTSVYRQRLAENLLRAFLEEPERLPGLEDRPVGTVEIR